jgi:hypothetical protein
VNVERRIITGLIVSADYLRRVAPFWDDDLLEGPEFRRIAGWCLEHFAEYHRAPDRDIEQVYLDAIRAESVPRAEAELIEDVLTAVSDEYDRGDEFNSAYLFDQTVRHFRDRELVLHTEAVADLRERGQLAEAEALAASFRPRSWATSRGLDVGTEPGYARVRAAFAQAARPLVRYPGALGEMLSPHLVRDGFVALMGPEKRGKTFWLTDIAFRALRQKCNVAFFQAGDMTENQYLRRMSIHLARRSDDPRYCAPHWRPVGDCALNQFNRCGRPDRNCDHGVFGEFEAFRDDPNSFQDLARLSAAAEADPSYRPCDSSACDQRWPVSWLEYVSGRAPLDAAAAERVVRAFFERHRRRFRLVTYPSGTLTCVEMTSCMDEWERQDDFVADVIIVDYADIMAASEREFRHRQNEVWMGLRGISQERHALVVTGTQADADSYRSELLGMGNFAEDKRKFSHVTAMFGLNQDPRGREKELGIMRLNTIVAREGSYSPRDVTHVLQHLAAGRPFTESYRVGYRPAAREGPT